MMLWEERLLKSHHDSAWDEKLKNGLGECQVILVAVGNYFENFNFATKQENLHIEKP